MKNVDDFFFSSAKSASKTVRNGRRRIAHENAFSGGLRRSKKKIGAARLTWRRRPKAGGARILPSS